MDFFISKDMEENVKASILDRLGSANNLLLTAKQGR